jgi:hypothetical protein
MNSFKRLSVTAVVFAGMTILLSGCIAYDAASTVVSVGATVVTTTADVAGDIVTAPFDSSEPKKK